ncbi:YkgJ family cysteine cluster protein [Photobacterium leiognathi]|uniref:YkgJ family cysteine cluster protein n=1 Tax=Photobacterium leiognathi TaxID=553611 RepID=UPI00298163B8|nr:YkgJ family cysteine cluster protein [Photobacterium leiognathi]
MAEKTLTELSLSPFPCNGCGKCCANVHLSEQTQELDRGDGICIHLDTVSKQCQIYEERPDICRVALQFERHYATQFSWNEFVSLNLTICEQLPDRLTQVSEEKLS